MLRCWLVGVPAAPAFAAGAVFAQSSATILGSQLREQGEETSGSIPLRSSPSGPGPSVGALLILASKTLIVAGLLRLSGEDPVTAWRGGLLLGVGGEFGLALLVIAMDSGVVGGPLVPIAISSVLLFMIGGSVLEPEETPAEDQLANRPPGPGPRSPSSGTDPAGADPKD